MDAAVQPGLHRRRAHRRARGGRLRGVGAAGRAGRGAGDPRRLPRPGRRRAGAVPHLPAGAEVRRFRRGVGDAIAAGVALRDRRHRTVVGRSGARPCSPGAVRGGEKGR
ncbi:hypothetical protein SBRY_20597 [Actinacidiphila bryophytorum]|uniref:Uncharacterized protein n=1 Tax=Actinacidiphila bryophytorum TaxID=1436133 RepID=A0A9W4GZP2_9ACTN|nr:hypothetical protein SBRY_20597 [Actinacidiphila bryophytorum]